MCSVVAYLPAEFYKLRDCVDPNILTHHALCGNPHPAAIKLIKKRIDEIDPSEIDWDRISCNPGATEIIEENPHQINWYYASANPASANPAVVHLLEEYPKTRINWFQLSYNTSPQAIALLENNPNRICAYAVAQNPAAVSIIQKYYKKNTTTDWGNIRPNIRFEYMAGNPAPEIIQYVKQEMHEFLSRADEEETETFWKSLSRNPSDEAIKIMLQHPSRMNWRQLSANSSPLAIEILLQNKDKIDYEGLCKNQSPVAFQILLDELRRILCPLNGCCPGEIKIPPEMILARNPVIFTYDYDHMRASREALHADFAAWFWSPARVAALVEADVDIEEEYF